MNNVGSTARRVADILRIFEYAAMLFVSGGVLLGLLKIPYSRILDITGVTLVVLAPVAGVVAVGVLSQRSGNRRMLYFSMIVVAVYIVGYFLAR